MAIHVADCPRCKARNITFDVLSASIWQEEYFQGREVYLIECSLRCRNCHGTSVIQCSTYESNIAQSLDDLIALTQRIDQYLSVSRFLNLTDVSAEPPPEHLPSNIKAIVVEGSKCFSVGCYNAAGAMFRLCLDLASKTLLPPDGSDGITPRQRKYLADRMDWLFDNKHWPESLRDLATCIRQDGNDGAHDGDLGADEAEDLQEFTFLILEKIYTEPARIRLSQERRQRRKNGEQSN